jgi:serine/threonine protein kinase
MVYGATPFSSITQLLPKLHAIANPNLPISFPRTGSEALEDVRAPGTSPATRSAADSHWPQLMRRALERDPAKRITIPEILAHPFIRPPPAALDCETLANALLCCSRTELQKETAAALAAALLSADAPMDVASWLERRQHGGT